MPDPGNTTDFQLNRREFGGVAAAVCASPMLRSPVTVSADEFKLNYLLASCMYGYLYIGEILPEVSETGATAIDLWPKIHGNQREQLDDLGEPRFAELLKKNKVQLGCLTQYKLGPFGFKR